MNANDPHPDQLIETVLARLPEWQPPAGFAYRVAARAVEELGRTPWIALVLRGLGLAACVSIAAWLGGEVLSAALRSAAVLDTPGAMSWTLAIASLVVAWRCVRRNRPVRA